MESWSNLLMTSFPDWRALAFWSIQRALIERWSRGQVASAAHARGLTMLAEEASKPEAVAPAIDRMAKAGAQVVIVQPNGMFINQRSAILKQVLAARPPKHIRGSRSARSRRVYELRCQ